MKQYHLCSSQNPREKICVPENNTIGFAGNIAGCLPNQGKPGKLVVLKKYLGKSGNLANARDNQGKWENICLCFFNQSIS